MFLNDAASPQLFTSPRNEKKTPGHRPRLYVSQPAHSLSVSVAGRLSTAHLGGQGWREFMALSRLITRGGYEDGKDQLQHFPRLLGQVGRLEPWYVPFQASAEHNEP